MHVVMLTEEVLGFLEPPDQRSGSPVPAGDGFQQIAQPLEGDPGLVRLIGVVGTLDPTEIVP